MMKKFFHAFGRRFIPTDVRDWEDRQLIIAAKSLINSSQWQSTPVFSDPLWIQTKEFRVYSQFGDDGIIQWLIRYLDLPARGRFVEFGVGDFFESNTHFLLVNNHWEGYVMDGDDTNISAVKNSPIYWRYRLHAEKHFITRENIMLLLEASGFDKIELLHIDLDGNDYWILECLDLEAFRPDILILEYNALFGSQRLISVPYNPYFNRIDSHYSGKYFGASLQAMNFLARQKGYYFIGCNSAGNNAYFLSSLHRDTVPEADIFLGYQIAGFREARNKAGVLTFLEPRSELELVKGLSVMNVVTGAQEVL